MRGWHKIISYSSEKRRVIKGIIPLGALFIVLLPVCLRAQIVSGKEKIDSMLTVLRKSTEDTGKVKTINSLVLQLIYTGRYKVADSLVGEEMRLSNALGYKLGVANAYNNMGVIFNYQGDYSHSLDYLIKSLQLYQALDYKDGMGIAYKYIGSVYGTQGDTTNAMNYFNKALNIFSEIKDTNYIATSLLSIGNLCGIEGRHDAALENLQKSVRLFKDVNNKDGVASSLMYIGSVYTNEKNYDSARSYLTRGEEIFASLNDKDGISRSLSLLGSVFLDEQNYVQALDCENNSLAYGKEIGSFDCIMNAEEVLSRIYEQKGDGANALLHYRGFVAARDSIFNQQTTMKMVSAEMNFEYEKKRAIQKANDEKREALHKEELKRQETILYSVSGMLLLLALFSIFVYRTSLQRKKDNRIIEAKNYQITQSISYAERIQNAMLPDKPELHGLLPQSFVLFRPRDIVSGDFYFLGRKDEKIILAAADCTGHGVPGGFMSMLCSEKLNEAIHQTHNSGEILTYLNQGVKSSLHQSESEDSTYDGMDIALCVILPSVSGLKLTYSGANRPLWVIRNGSNEIEEIKPTLYTIGGFTPIDQEYSAFILQLHPGDTFYVFSDGYVDQFGGPNGKKLGVKRFKQLLLSIQNKTMEEQEKELGEYIDKWRGSTGQLDDMLVIGVRVA